MCSLISHASCKTCAFVFYLIFAFCIFSSDTLLAIYAEIKLTMTNNYILINWINNIIMKLDYILNETLTEQQRQKCKKHKDMGCKHYFIFLSHWTSLVFSCEWFSMMSSGCIMSS